MFYSKSKKVYLLIIITKKINFPEIKYHLIKSADIEGRVEGS